MPAVGVPFTGVALVELEELPFDAVDPLGVPIGVAVDELEELPFDVLDPLLELDWDELAEAPQAVSINTKILKTVIAVTFFIRSPFCSKGCSISRALFALVKKMC